MDILFAALILGASVIISSAIFSGFKHRTEIKKKELEISCKHDWEILERFDMKRSYTDGYGSSRKFDYTKYILKCKKCGDITSREE